MIQAKLKRYIVKKKFQECHSVIEEPLDISTRSTGLTKHIKLTFEGKCLSQQALENRKPWNCRDRGTKEVESNTKKALHATNGNSE